MSLELPNDEDSELWDSVKKTIQTFVSFEDTRHYDLVTGFVLATYIQDQVLEFAPYLQLIGTPASGKSTLLRVLERLCFNAHRCVSETSAVLFRTIDEQYPCTLLLDEVGSYTGELHEGVLAILRAGNEMDAVVRRIVGKEDLKPKEFRCGGMKAFAGSKGFETALSSRCIKIVMQRVKNTKFRRKSKTEIDNTCSPVRSQLTQWRGINKSRPLFEDLELFHSYDRVYDIFRALMTVCPDDRSRQILISLGTEMAEEAKEDEGDTIDAIVKDAILFLVKRDSMKEGDPIPIKLITSTIALGSDSSNVNSWRVGQACRRLGLKRKKIDNERCILYKASTLGTVGTFQEGVPGTESNSKSENNMSYQNVQNVQNVPAGQVNLTL